MSKPPKESDIAKRRRETTRKSMYSSNPDATGGRFKTIRKSTKSMKSGDELTVKFEIPSHNSGEWVGFGGWFLATSGCSISFSDNVPSKRTSTQPCAPDWSKFGTMFQGTGVAEIYSTVFRAENDSEIVMVDLACGVIYDEHLSTARENLLKNMFQFSPEAHFYSTNGITSFTPEYSTLTEGRSEYLLYVKECDRCARYLPINSHRENIHLSFTNHCRKEEKQPCKHHGLGKLRNVETEELIQFDYGFQRECRYCKKFKVNAEHNKQRTSAQLKEDSARRRALEALIAGLLEESALLIYRAKHNRELADVIWENFDEACFNCGEVFENKKQMQLDHTRPLALLWPLDGSATALCGFCNSSKSDLPPVEFYKDEQLVSLSEITGLSLEELRDPSPNKQVINKLMIKLDWFFDKFLTTPNLVKDRDGKTAAELVINALQKVLNKCPGGAPFDILEEFEQRR